MTYEQALTKAEKQGGSSELTELAAALDPPKPAPGTVVWYKSPNREWRLGIIGVEGHTIEDGTEAPYRADRCEIKPARILAPGEVAVTVPPIDAWPSGVHAMCWQWQAPPVSMERAIITRAEAEEMEQ